MCLPLRSQRRCGQEQLAGLGPGGGVPEVAPDACTPVTPWAGGRARQSRRFAIALLQAGAISLLVVRPWLPSRALGGCRGVRRTELELGCPGEPPPFGSQPPTSLPTQRRETPRFLSPFPIASPMPVVCRAVPATQAAGPGRAPPGGQGSGFACPDPRHPWGHPCRGPRGSVWSCPQLGG